ncbi:hypothetical protein SAMN05421752_1325 [Natronorubrum thiooxidans]|uniref:Uncharacterized protein n=1 Tax=Natronorubrum thiooxidans TaxID=308853 RepID=A0A1N7H8C6_9EURY|nr:hypothetical protein SAMN05421752_1325 [Natronorubrum thiooxidans]
MALERIKDHLDLGFFLEGANIRLPSFVFGDRVNIRNCRCECSSQFNERLSHVILTTVSFLPFYKCYLCDCLFGVQLSGFVGVCI